VLEGQNKSADNSKHIQNNNCLEDKNYNYKNDELDFSSFQQSFETFAMPESKDNFMTGKEHSLFGKMLSTKEDEILQPKEIKN
jgi:hypothetical protein